MQFDFRDLFKSLRIAFSVQRIWIEFTGLLLGYAGYFVFSVVSLLLSGFHLQQILARFGLFPWLIGANVQVSVTSKIVFALGLFFLLAVHLVTSTAVARASFMVLKGNHYFTWREAFSFAFKKCGSTLLTPVAVGIFILGGLVGISFLGFLGRIPFLGELSISMITTLWMLASFLLMFLILVSVVAVVLAPAIIATTNEDAFEAVFQSFSTAWSQPVRLVVYEGLATAIAVFGFGVLAVFAKTTFVFISRVFSFAMGDNFINLASHAQYLLQSWTITLDKGLHIVLGKATSWFFFSRDFIPLQLPPTLQVSSYIFALNMMVIGALVLSYLFATYDTGNMMTYLILRKLKDDENLLDRSDRDESVDEEGEATNSNSQSG